MNVPELLTLLEYNHWANERIFQRATRLSTEQLTVSSWLSHGTLLQTLVHNVDTVWSWRACCQQGVLPAEYITEKSFPDIASLRKFSQAESEQWLAYIRSLTDEQVNGEIEYSWPRARPRRQRLWHVVAHVVNHGTQHRSEAGAYLATCGHSPGNLDLIIFTSKHKRETSS